jgi:hypothetical protein
MLRRSFAKESRSRLAVWSAKLAWFALAVAALSIVVVRSGVLEIVPALTAFAAALVFAAFAVLLAIGAFISIWRVGRLGLGRAVLGFFLGLALLAYPAYLGFRAMRLPPIYDVTTDTADPPRFEALAPQRPLALLAYPGRFAPLQQKAYSGLNPQQYDAPAKLVYDIALALVEKRKWRVAAAAPPAPGRSARIEAVARSFIMGIPDDVVIRISGSGGGAVVDVRLASRHPWPDMGANAARAQSLLDDIDEAVSSAPDSQKRKPEPAQKAEPMAPPKKPKR